MTTIADSGPIISFARSGRFGLLQQILSELVIPDAVYEEIVIRGQGKPAAVEVQQSSWIQQAGIHDRSIPEQMPSKLNLGERKAIALPKEMGGNLLVDETEARIEALRLGIHCFGSLRVIKEAIDRRIITTAKPVLDLRKSPRVVGNRYSFSGECISDLSRMLRQRARTSSSWLSPLYKCADGRQAHCSCKTTETGKWSLKPAVFTFCAALPFGRPNRMGPCATLWSTISGNSSILAVLSFTVIGLF